MYLFITDMLELTHDHHNKTHGGVKDLLDGLKATIDDIACSIGSENSSPTLSSSPRTSGPRSISSQLSKLIYFLYILCYI